MTSASSTVLLTFSRSCRALIRGSSTSAMPYPRIHLVRYLHPRASFRCYWRWKSRSLGGQPQIETDLRALIRRMSVENPLWGAPRTHGELLKLGFEVAQSSVAKYMIKRRGPPSQGWRTFLHNHASDIAAMDLFVVPTVSRWGSGSRTSYYGAAASKTRKPLEPSTPRSFGREPRGLAGRSLHDSKTLCRTNVVGDPSRTVRHAARG